VQEVVKEVTQVVEHYQVDQEAAEVTEVTELMETYLL
jgi:hypothetical protein